MTRLRVSCLSLSLDGFGAGPCQDLDNPLGVGGLALHRWMMPTLTAGEAFGGGEGHSGTDDDFARRGLMNVGAWILGRNMFGPIRGAWPDDGWKGWWGDTPPYHCDVFVLTNHPRQSFAMAGGTTFHFVTDGIHYALDRARTAAAGRDIRLGGGVATVRQYLKADLVDEIHLVVAPVLLGAGEHLLADIDLPALGFEVTEYVAAPAAAHYVLSKRSPDQ